MLAMNADYDSNAVVLPTDNVDQPTWREDMLQKRIPQKKMRNFSGYPKRRGRMNSNLMLRLQC